MIYFSMYAKTPPSQPLRCLTTIDPNKYLTEQKEAKEKKRKGEHKQSCAIDDERATHFTVARTIFMHRKSIPMTSSRSARLIMPIVGKTERGLGEAKL